MILRALGLLLLFGLFASTAHARLLGGDSIGPDSSFTDGTGAAIGGVNAASNFGQPGVQVSLDGASLLQQMRLIVAGQPSSLTSRLDFSLFRYRVEVFTKDGYLADSDPVVRATVQPFDVNYVEVTPGTVLPDVTFGDIADSPPSIPTYDFGFDLSNAVLEGTSTLACSNPLVSDDYIITLQNTSNLSEGGFFVVYSESPDGYLPYYSRDSLDGVIPRGILGNQDPSDIFLRYGWNISVRTPGDYDDDGDVDTDDYQAWRDNYGATGDFPVDGLNADGVVNAADYTVWRDNFGLGVPASLGESQGVPEPTAAVLLCMVLLSATLPSRLL